MMSWLHNLKIKTRITLVIGAILISILVFGGLSYFLLSSYTISSTIVNITRKYDSHYSSAMLSLYKYLSSEDQKDLDDFNIHINNAERYSLLFSKTKKLLETKSKHELARQYLDVYPEINNLDLAYSIVYYLSIFSDYPAFLKLIDISTKTHVEIVKTKKLVSIGENLKNKTILLQLDKSHKRVDKLSQDFFKQTVLLSEAITTLGKKALFIFIVVFIIASFSIHLIVSRSLIEPIKLLVDTTKEIAKGNLNKRISYKSKDELGQLSNFFNRMLDHINKQQLSLEEALAEAKLANTSKSIFLANMSHELRTPLSAIIGYSEMLEEDARDEGNEEYLSDLERIVTSAKHLLSIINDILDVSKIEAGKVELYLEQFDIYPFIRDITNIVIPLSEKNSNLLVISCPEKLGVMYSDLTKIRQILYNLLSNSCKFTKEGTITLTVTKQAVLGSDFVFFKIVDTGIGMSEEHISRAFSPFTQADYSTTRKFGGTGLGLTISKSFAIMMGGDIVIQSRLEKGSTFTLKLPQKLVQKDFTSEPSKKIKPLDKNVFLQKFCTLLVIDDDPNVHDIIKRLLEGSNFKIITATDGVEGLKLAREIKPNIITLDVMMPKKDGWTVLSEIKNDPELFNIPVIMLTIKENKQMGYALGATEFLTKPINQEKIFFLLSKYQVNEKDFRVLVVEDERQSRDMLKRMLQKTGSYVLEAGNGRTALDLLAKSKPSLILLDLMMPEMDGFEFVIAVRKSEELKDIPIIVLTAKDLSKKERARLSGYVENILQKGTYNMEELMEEVSDLLSRCARD